MSYRNIRQGELAAATGDSMRTRMLFLLGLCGLTVAMALITTAEGVVFRAQRGDPIELGLLLSGRLADWFTCAVLVPPLYWLTTQYPIERTNWQRAASIHLAASAAAACLKFVLYVPLRRALDPGYEGTIIGAIGADFLGKLMFFWAVIGMLHALFFYQRFEQEAQELSASGATSPLHPRQTIAVPDGRGVRYLPQADIEWIEAQGNYLQIHARSGRYLLRETMHGISQKLDSDLFVRVHRSIIVNFASVCLIERASNSRYRLTLHNGHTVTSARSHLASLRGLVS